MGARALTIVVTIGAVLILLDVYAFQGVKALANATNPDLKIAIIVLYWIISIGTILGLLLSFVRFISGKRGRKINPLLNFFPGLLFTKLVFVLILFLEDIYRVVWSLLFNSEVPRSAGVSSFGLIVASIPFFAVLFGVTKGKYNYKVRRTTIYYDDLPPAFDGFTVAHFSDVHAGSFDSFDEVKKGVELINSQKPDVVVFTGDLVNNKAAEIVPYIGVFSDIQAPFGKFSVLGNHDYGDYISWGTVDEKRQNLERLKKYHADMGFKLLLDEHVLLRKGEAGIALLGVQNWGLGFGQRGDLNRALHGITDNNFKILLSHDPTHWDAVVKKHPVPVHLTLSGHTHGMQFGIEAFGIKWSPAQYRYKHWAGLASENGRYLYINRGFGFLGFSGRVGIWPEITIIELRIRSRK